VYLELGKIYEEINSTSSINNAIKLYREGIKVYKEIIPETQTALTQVYSKLCTQTAKLLQSCNKLNDADINEIEFLFKESTIFEPENSDTWYRLGNFFLERNKYDEALQNLEKAKSLAPQKVYISHKIAQTYYGKENLDQALKVYESIPDHKRTDYILHGMAKCLLKQGKTKEGASHLFKAIKQDPNKFYLHRDFGLALIDLGDRDQGIEELEKANKLYKKDNGEDQNKIIAKIEESRNIPHGEHIVFEEPVSSIVTISYGVVTKYNSERGFGLRQRGGQIFC
jgi:tetratricopeptide (TPR) repeat protein